MSLNRSDTSHQSRFLLLGMWFFFAVILVQTAWVSDDAYITARSIENFIHGYGPTYNVLERVQSFTHPLWFFVLSAPYALLVRVLHIPFASLMYYLFVSASIAFTLSALALLLWSSRSRWRVALLAGLMLTFSKAFVEYGTSGLETPLTYALLAAFSVLYLDEENFLHGHRRELLFLAGGLLALNRLDTILLVFPALALVFWRQPGRNWKPLVLGFSPLLVWEVFSLLYYGFPFPNTAYAKLNTGLGTGQLLRQGTFYFLNSIDVDPLTLLVVASVAAFVLLFRRKEHRSLALVTGILLYLGYVLRIGGDFMSGRFFAAPFFLSVWLFSRLELDADAVKAVLVAVLLLGLTAPTPPVFSNQDYGVPQTDFKEWITPQGIADERAVYYPALGLLTADADKAFAASPWAGVRWKIPPHASIKPMVVGPAGVTGYMAGPVRHLVDRNALIDPLLARLPIEDMQHWRIGHFHRALPDGYLETLENGQNRLRDPNLARYYEHLSLVTHGEIFTWKRLKTIWALNTGAYTPLLQAYLGGGEP